MQVRRARNGLQDPVTPATVLLTALSLLPTAMAQGGCISLSGSKTCPAFSSASVGKTQFLIDHYPFLQYVSDTASFDTQLKQYVQEQYVQRQFQGRFGCTNTNLVNTTDYYARFTTSVICNGIVQNSIQACGLNTQQSAPLCAASCAEFAQSEAMIVGNSNLCANPVGNIQELIRADFADCSVPTRSLSNGGCVSAINNQPDNCGYASSTLGICSYCSSGGINSTDTCCYNSDINKLCANVVLPNIVSTMTFSTPAPTSTTPSSTDAPDTAASNRNMGLSGGAIAGIVIGCIAGIVLIALAVLFCLRSRRNRKGSQQGSVFNQPSPSRKGPQTTKIPTSSTPPQGYEVLPGGRIARMSALEGHSGDSPSRHSGSRQGTATGAAAAAGGAAGYMLGRRRGNSSSDDFSDSHGPETRSAALRPPPTSRRQGSLSSGSILAGEDPSSPTSAGGISSGAAVNSQQSEQLPFFKDYYSQDDIHPGEPVAVLWAYQPRAQDEFSLERGDMIKVVGIWDDGWATGVMMDERAEEWEIRRQTQRDSGVSNASGRGRDPSPPVSGEIKAFPLVCVCLPEHWRKTIEGDGSTENGSAH